jgi:hypothetical protein
MMTADLATIALLLEAAPAARRRLAVLGGIEAAPGPQRPL